MGRWQIESVGKRNRASHAAKSAKTLSAITYANSRKNIEIPPNLGIAFAV